MAAMAQIDAPADEDTGGLIRPPVVAESPDGGDDADDLAAHGLDVDGSRLGDSTDGTRRASTPGNRRNSASGASNPASNGLSNGHRNSGTPNGSTTGVSLESPSSNGLARPVMPVAPPAPFDLAYDEFAAPQSLDPDSDSEGSLFDDHSFGDGSHEGALGGVPAADVGATPIDDLVARTPPLRPYIEDDPTGPVISPAPIDPRTTRIGETRILPVSPVTFAVPASITPAPTIRPGIRLRRRPRPRVRRVRRVIRSVDTWTVFKVSLIFYLAMYVIFLVASVLLWRVANATGTLDNIQTFLTHYGWETFKFRGGEIYHAVWIIGLFLVVAGVGLNVTVATLFNLIADLVGGVRVTVLEEEVRLRPRVQITKAVMPHQAPAAASSVAPTPGEPIDMPTGPRISEYDPGSVELAPDFTSDIVWIAPTSQANAAAASPVTETN